ncbi:MAG: hypothetical protein HOL80_03230 [Candidatus Magasanikbacteria bacterium]|jgi:hypothetical protein|nr:hypothetical protein [Candidatus Magasanikbacteria bacterium]MBT5262883.1 hypothetical protein [Candidatus Magasanikbacteria bacterium]MBT5820036.1 hypothetical protein [Candidatus Magasanikbacteria bacterium]MBT6294682.1 hypothetical protein [Candidatus Magasanikbacteria bacterium]
MSKSKQRRQNSASRVVLPFSTTSTSHRRGKSKKTAHTTTRFFILLTILLGCVFGMVGIFLYHPFFRISQITVSGLERINKQAFLSATEGIIDYKVLFFLPKSSFSMVGEKEVGMLLSQKFPIAHITVTKDFPDKLNIVVEEKISSIIYDNGETYSFLGLDGTVVEHIRNVGEDEWFGPSPSVVSPSSTEQGIVVQKKHRIDAERVHKEMGKYPILYDEFSHSVVKKNEERVVVVSPQSVVNIITWFERLDQDLGVSIAYFRLHKDRRNMDMVTKDNRVILIRIDGSAEEQLTDLVFVYKKILSQPVSFIDVRQKEKVYFY